MSDHFNFVIVTSSLFDIDEYCFENYPCDLEPVLNLNENYYYYGCPKNVSFLVSKSAIRTHNIHIQKRIHFL